MRTGGTLYHSIRATQMTTAEATASSKATFSPPATIQASPWHSPVPYLFGGLAAMLGLIAFALLILACSYWKLSGEINSEDDGDTKEGSSSEKGSVVFEEKFLVIMAGNVRPTFLATPCMSNKATSANDEKSEASRNQTEEKEKEINDENKTVHENFGESESESGMTHEQSH